MIKPTRGLSLIETRVKDGGGILLADGTKSGDKQENIIVAVSNADKDLEWKVGDSVALGEGAKGFVMEHGKKSYVCMPNSFIIAVL